MCESRSGLRCLQAEPAVALEGLMKQVPEQQEGLWQAVGQAEATQAPACSGLACRSAALKMLLSRTVSFDHTGKHSEASLYLETDLKFGPCCRSCHSHYSIYCCIRIILRLALLWFENVHAQSLRADESHSKQVLLLPSSFLKRAPSLHNPLHPAESGKKKKGLLFTKAEAQVFWRKTVRCSVGKHQTFLPLAKCLLFTRPHAMNFTHII